MIRPLTIAAFLLACGSGLYLYQSKHEVQLLDQTIERTVHDTNGLREQSRLLAVEWTMLNDPERLRRFSDTYLNLKAIDPRQFASLADLDDRLPSPRPEVPPRGSEEQKLVPVDTVSGAPVPEAYQGGGAEEVLPLPPIPAAHPVVAVAPAGRPAAEPKAAETRVPVSRPPGVDNQARSVPAADARVNDQRVAEPRVAPRVAENRAEVRPLSAPPPRPIVLTAPRPLPIIARLYTQPAPTPVSATAPPHPAMNPIARQYVGSLLGMAHGTMPAAPRPMPVNGSYNAN